MQNFLNRPLFMNIWANALFYGFLGVTLNNCINHFWVTEKNPEGLDGFAGWAVLFLSIGLATFISNRENDWVREIQKAQKTG